MLQLDYAFSRPTHRPITRPHFAALSAVALLHVLIAAAFINAIQSPKPGLIPDRIQTDIRDMDDPTVVLIPPDNPVIVRPPPPVAPPVPSVVILRPAGPSHAITPERPADPPVVQPPPPETRSVPARPIMSTQTGPQYPVLSRRLREEGSVRLRLTIGTDGRVINAEVLESSGAARLDDAATAWVLRRWRYEPATVGGQPVEATTEATLTFRLEE